MPKYSCIIVEDEPLAVEILTDYISQIPFLELKCVCGDAIYAMEVLQREKIDLIFLDIHLPKLKGIDFLESLKYPPRVIITSAYQEYALQAFDGNVTDYLLKPIRFTRFLKAVNKLNQQVPIQAAASNLPFPERRFLFFNVAKKKVKIYLDEIYYVESMREYVRITAQGTTIMTKFVLNEVEDLFANDNFIRVHRSFIVSKERITAFSSNEVEVNGVQIPIGRTYKDFVLSVLEGPAIN
ncbi:MAG TPA: response regulator transcription factor [Chitinophagaceae bacterium]|jgi:DNA-binding LytR/AlgR family response regulator|nr:response regulator transcription factor [Chitinophagaceae bacterium]